MNYPQEKILTVSATKSDVNLNNYLAKFFFNKIKVKTTNGTTIGDLGFFLGAT